MRLSGGNGRLLGVRGDVAALLATSLACIVILGYGLQSRDLAAIAGLPARKVLLLAIGTGAMVFVAASVGFLLSSLRRARLKARSAQVEADELRRQLAASTTALKAEPHVLLHWEGGEPRLVVHALEAVPGLPVAIGELLRFGAWLEADAARELGASLDALFLDGKPFNMLLRTLAGGHLEADGRVAGARAILKLRDVAGQKRELARIVDQQRRLGRDIAVGRALFDALPMPVWLRSADGRIEWVNRAYAKSVEAESPDEVASRQVELLESRQRKAVEQVLARRETYRERVHVIVAGERRAFDLVVLPLERASAGVAIDAAALESAQGELDRQSAAHDRTLDRVSTAVAVFGPDQRLSFFNGAFARLWELDPAWLAQKPTDGEILDRLRERRRLPDANYREFRAKALARYGSRTEQDDDWWHLPDARTVHLTVVPRPDGGLTYLYEDVTEELALKRRYELMINVQRETLDHLQEAVALFATDGRLKLFNPAFARIWRIERAALEREPHVTEVVERMRARHEEPAAWAQVVRAVTAFSDRRQPAAGQMQRDDGSAIDYALLPLPDGATLLSFADVTDSKCIERALLERNEALVAADRLKNQFISHVSYELRTPLQNIIGFAEMLSVPRTGELSEKQREYLAAILSSSETLKAIINGILDLATIDAGTLELSPGTLEVARLIEETVAPLRERLTRAGLGLDISLEPGVEELVADESRVKQVLSNLLSNAIGFSEPGKTVRLTCRRDGAMLLFAVEDQGVGISPEDQRRVFERFVSRAQGSNHRGVGLGLPLVKSLVELHGGSIVLESEAGRGTTVTVRLPERGKGAPQPPATAAETASPASVVPAEPELRRVAEG